MDADPLTNEPGRALVPTNEQTVEFYGDPIPVAQTKDGELYVPLRQLTDFLGLAADPQRRRVLRDEVLRERVQRIIITAADGKRYATLCLPLDLLPGWLFGITPNKTRPELAAKLRRYRAECFRVLWQAFKGDVVPEQPPAPAVSGAARAVEIAGAVYALAQQQLEIEQRLGEVAGRQEVMADYMRTFIQDTRQRLTVLERHTGATATLSDGQAAEIALAVKNVGQALTSRGDKNGYAQVYSELYRRWRVSSYKNLPAARYQEVLDWLAGWYAELQGGGTTDA